MSNILKYQNSSSPLLNPHKIIENIPAREWGPRKINEDYSITEGKGTNFWRAPFQYLGNKGLGVQNEKLARDLISEFDQMRSENPDYNYTLDKNYQSYDDAINYINHLEGLKKYLHLPYDTGLLMESKYKPTRLQGTNEKTYKFRSSMTPGYWNDVVDDMVFGEHSKNQYYDQSLNEFTAYRDRDEKGDFVSIYDEWDYNPAVRGGNKKWNKLIDTLTGGTPFVIYDRVYLDDYYDIPEEARGNPFITPAVVTAEAKKFGGIIKAQNSAKLISKINQSDANFVKRLLDPNRKSIPDWETKGQKIATHKMSWGEDEHGAYVFPEVQEIDGQLIDFSRPPYASGIADYMAHKNNNIIRMSPEEADWFTRNYKQYYPSFKKGGSIHIKKKNRGKFTEYCGGKVTEECIAKGKKSKDPKIRKRATFAANARRWKHENGGILKAQEGTGNLYAPHPLSPVGIALNQARAMAKGNKNQQHLPPGVKEVVGPDGKKVAIRTGQPLQPLEQSIAEWLPGTGDVAEVGYIANDVKNGNYGSAALAAAMIALPGNVGKIFRKSDVPASKLTEAERLGIPKGERNQPLNGHLKGDAAVQMFKEYGTQFPEDMVRLYRASGTSGNFKPSLDGTAKYAGMWFTDNPSKVNRYASSTFKTAKRNGVDNPIVLEYIDIPKSQLDQFRAKNIIKGNDVEFEPTEDFLIPIDHTGRKQVSWTGFTGNYLSDMRIPHPELPLISKNSKIYSQIQQLVPEARERYKLVGRTDITDDEIAGSLYKRAMELNGNDNAAVWTETGEPRLLFRGDTRRYNRLMDKWSPEKLAKGKGTMDNSLGNLFLGDISGKGQGVDRYFISGNDFFEPIIQGSATGARGKFGTIFDSGGEGVQGTVIPYIPKDAYKLSTYQTYHVPYSLYKFPGKYSESGISDLNAFITRTPAMRDATGEISVLADDVVMKTKNYRDPNIDDYDGPTSDGVNSTVRDAMAKHYQSVLDDAQSKGQGLLFSEGLTDEYVKKFGEIHPFRREHEWYDYYALPNFNRQNAKHLFGWDLRRPVQWDIDNIYLEQGGKL